MAMVRRHARIAPRKGPPARVPHSRIEGMPATPRTLILLLTAVTAIPGGRVWAAQPVRARHGMVVTRERHATEAGLQVLAAGGNAVDAAVAVGFALAVTHSSAGNIGGGGFMLLRLADGRTTFIDFRERAPEAASRNMYLDANGKATQDSTLGYRASGVPGTVRGMEYASQKYGKLPWAELVRPAVELASKGFALSYAQAQSLRSGGRGLARFPESNRIFLQRRQVLRTWRYLCAARPGPHAWSASRVWEPRIFTRARPPACWPKICRPTAA